MFATRAAPASWRVCPSATDHGTPHSCETRMIGATRRTSEDTDDSYRSDAMTRSLEPQLQRGIGAPRTPFLGPHFQLAGGVHPCCPLKCAVADGQSIRPRQSAHDDQARQLVVHSHTREQLMRANWVASWRQVKLSIRDQASYRHCRVGPVSWDTAPFESLDAGIRHRIGTWCQTRERRNPGFDLFTKRFCRPRR